MSGFGHDDLYEAEQAHISRAAGTNAVAALQAGHPFALLLAADDRQREAALDNLLDLLADPNTRFARVTNPLRARLTLERLLIQVIHDVPERMAAGASAIIRAIAERFGTENRVLLVIERAETLHPEVLRFFAQTAPLFPDGSPRLQVLFVGRPEFRPLLDDPNAGFDEQTALLEQYRPKTETPAFPFAPTQTAAEVEPQRPLPFLDTSLRAQFMETWNRGFLVQVTMLGTTLVGCAAIGFAGYLIFSRPTDPTQVDTTSALAELPDPGEADPDPPVLQPGPPANDQVAALRREFEAYLVASGKDIVNATPAQRRTTYNEFLAWRTRTTGAPPPAAATSTPGPSRK